MGSTWEYQEWKGALNFALALEAGVERQETLRAGLTDVEHTHTGSVAARLAPGAFIQSSE